MSTIATTGSIASAAGDAYGASQGEGGLNSSSNQAAFGAAVASAASTIAAAASSPTTRPGLFGLATGLAPAASATQLALNISNLQNASTPGDGLAAAAGILGGAAGTLANLIPPAAMLTPQGAALKAALTAISIAATALQLWAQLNPDDVNEFINDMVTSWNSILFDFNDFFANVFNRAKNWTWPRDPIILDLSGDGLQTTGLSSNIHFDHNGDGVLTRTGWVGKNDALLVWDRNSNGTIDTGAELFGDFTPLPNGSLAPNGFAALAALDANGDGVIDASDPAFGELKLWRDTDQDGVTGEGELISLADAGIASLSLTNTIKNQATGNGNTLAREGSFTRSDGTTSAMGEFHFATDTVDTKFAEEIEVPEALKSLPTMQGSGNVRELHQSAAQSGAVAGLLSQFQSASTRTEQKTVLEQLITAWAGTSNMAKSLEERAAGQYRIQYEAFGNVRRSSSIDAAAFASASSGSPATGGALMSDDGGSYLTEEYRQLITDWNRKIHVLEAFNGQHFFNLPQQPSQTSGARWGFSVSSGSRSGSGAAAVVSLPTLKIQYSQTQLDLLDQAYESLTESVYASLVMQTRLKPYLDQIELVINDDGLSLNANQLNQTLADKRVSDPENALADLLDLDRYAGSILAGTNWEGLTQFDSMVEALPDTPSIAALLAEFNVQVLTGGDDSVSLSSDSNIALAGEGNDRLSGNNGNDRLFGQAGDDKIYGGNGDDLLSGGAGNDVLEGGSGADTYIFSRGFGHDTILDSVENEVRVDMVRFSGLSAADVQVSADFADNLTFTIRDTGETLKVPATGSHWRANGIGRYVFDDGTSWSHEDALRATVASTTDGDDVIQGSSASDTITGQAGNDTLIGNGGDDIIDGGVGDDRLIGSTGWEYYNEDGQWLKRRSTSSAVDANGSDTYLFGRGDGQDTVIDGDYTEGNVDTLQFKEGVAPSDVRLVRNEQDLILEIRGSTDQITLKQYFNEDWRGHQGPYLIENIDFADGTRWTFTDVQDTLFAGSEEADVIVGSRTADHLRGQDGNDTLIGRMGDDLLEGGGGDDILRGDAGEDTLDGGNGNDELRGGHGADIYRFGRGDGHDIIIDNAWLEHEKDRIEFKAGTNANDVKLERVGSVAGWHVYEDLKITIRDTGETLTVKNHFNESNRYAVAALTFADGTTWDAEAIKSRSLLGEEGNDELRGFNNRDDVIAGGAGDDRLLGASGNDVLSGGAGNDALAGGDGSDIYHFGLGDGQDSITEGYITGEDVAVLGAGIAPTDVIVRWTLQGDMAISLSDGSKLIVRGQADHWSDQVGIEQLQFADGTIWNRADLATRALAASDGEDAIVGGYDGDVLVGGLGDDHFEDLGGYDIYRFGIGDGQDTITDSAGSIHFEEGIDQNGISFSREGNDLIARVDSSNDSIKINGWLSNGGQIDSFNFANGAQLGASEVRAKLNASSDSEIIYGSPGDDTLTGTEKSSSVYGREGNDILHGGAGDDWLYGEAGNDVLDGGTGRDWLYGGAGDNTYLMTSGMGLDRASGQSLALANDTVIFAADIRPEDVSVQLGERDTWNQQPGDIGYIELVIGIGGNDALVLRNENWDDLGRGAIQHFRFENGTEWSLADLVARADDGVMGYQDRYWGDTTRLLGSQADDTIYDYSGQSLQVQARGNDDYINLSVGNDIVSAGTGDDRVYSGQGEDLVAGEMGDDRIDTGDGDDVAAFNYGDGQDTLTTGQGLDTLSFGATVAPAMLSAMLDRYGRVTLLIDNGVGGKITLDNDYANGQSVDLERIQFIDNKGATRVFDFTSWLQASGPSLLAATAATPLPFDGSSFEVTGKEAPAGGLQAIAYAQSGDLFASPSLANNTPTDSNDVLYGTPEDDTLNAEAGDDIVIGLAGNDVIMGGDGNDLVLGGDGDDDLDGGAGNDVIYGGWGADTLTGGTGRDELYGEWGGDAYIYQRGHGEVIIDDDHRVLSWGYGGEGGYGGGWDGGEGGYGGPVLEPYSSLDGGEGGYGGGWDGGYGGDWGGGEGGYSGVIVDHAPNVLEFGAGIRAEDLRYSERDGDLVIGFVNQPGDRVVLRGYEPSRATQTRSVDIIRFADGTEIVTTTLEPSGITEMVGDEGGWLSGTPFSDTLFGGDGDDVLTGEGGSDRLIGGAGSDTYRVYRDLSTRPSETLIAETWREQDFNRIELTGAFNAEDLRLEFDGSDLLLSLTENGDSIRFAGFDPSAPGMQAPVDEVNFPWSGETLSFAELLGRGIRIIGTPESDSLNGTALADWIEGREADDTLQGGAGGDLYIIDADTGIDTIIDSEDGDAANVLVLPEGTRPSDIRLSFDEEGFLLIDLDNTGNRIRLSGFDPMNPLGPRAIERFRFGLEGLELGYEELLEQGFDIYGTEENDSLKGTTLADRIWGDAGNDLIEATSGGDWLAGEDGNDVYLVNLGDGVVTIEDLAEEDSGNVLRFGPDIDPDALRNNLRFEEDGNDGYVLLIPYGGAGDMVRLTGFNPADVLGSHAVDQFEFSDGTTVDYATLVSWTFVIEGDNSGNALEGTNVGDRLYGYDGDDVLEANDGEDVLTGGIGNDVLRGGAGRDAYVVNLGDGEDLIEDDLSGTLGNVLTFGEGIAREDVRVDVDGSDLLISYGEGGDSVRVSGYAPNGAAGNTVIDTFEFADGTAVTLREFMNQAPVLANPIGDQITLEDAAFSLTLPEDLFIDAEGDDILTRTAVSGYERLPQWLQYDADTRTLFGTPGNDDVGEFDVIVEGMDTLGASSLHSFHVTIQNTNDVPEVGLLLANQRILEDAQFVYELPADSFIDIDVGDALTFSASLPNGDALPEWLSFTPQTQTFSGMPTNSDVGNIQVRVTATDLAGLSVDQVFALEVVNTNDSPTVGVTIEAQQATEDANFTYALPVGAFIDADITDRLNFTATLANGDALPTWLQLDALTGVFSGTPGNEDVGNLQVRVIATDQLGASASQTFGLTVGNTNDAPEVAFTLTGQQAFEDALFNFALLENLFQDADVSDVLTYSVTQADGSTLPDWLSFDPETRTLSGLPVNNDVGSVSIKLTATDLAGAQASQVFALNVNNVNDAPEVGIALPDLSVPSGSPVNWQLPKDAFADADAGDVLTYSASLADGSALPDWLAFDTVTGSLTGTSNVAANYAIHITATDLAGAAVSQHFTLVVAAASESQNPVTGPDADTVTEDRRLLAWGNVLNNDHDPQGEKLRVVNPGITRGEYGGLKLLSNGIYAYVLDNFSHKVQSLGAGETGIDRFTYLASDGTNRTSGELLVTVQGTNDSPELSRRLPNVQLARGKDFSWQVPAGSFTDQDRNDSLDFTASLSNGKPLPSWLKFDAQSQTFSGTAPGNAKNSVSVRVTASDGHGHWSKATDVFKIDFGKKTILPTDQKGNEGVGNGPDAPPPGHTDNQNDGPGTGPGNPGNKNKGKECDPLSRFVDKYRSDEKPFSHAISHLSNRKTEHLNDRKQPIDDSLGTRDQGSDFSRKWSELTHALNKIDAERQGSPRWSNINQGADSVGIAGSMGGTSHAARNGVDSVSLTGGDTRLKGFTGLREGMSKLPW